MKENGPTIHHLESLANQLDENMSEDPTYRTPALVYLASVFLGPDKKKICDLIGIIDEEFYPIAERLEKSQVWIDGKLGVDGDVADSDDPAVASTAMLLDIMCAAGTVERRFDSE